MKLGSLFSGGGLGDFGFMAAGMEIAWQVEIDDYCQKILELRYPEAKKYRDIKTLKGAELEKVDIITGGFPCQPFSVAGKQKGKEDNRYLWPEMLRIIKECRPRWIVGENVPGIINLALDTVCTDLEAEGYEVWPIVFPSHALGAWHKRDRLWVMAQSRCSLRQGSFKQGENGLENTKQDANINQRPSEAQFGQDVAYANNSGSQGWNGEELSECSSQFSTGESGTQIIHNPMCRRYQLSKEQVQSGWNGFVYSSWWKFEPSVGRVANGIADRVHRLKMLGNGQVPACTYVLGQMIMEIENNLIELPKKD